MKNSFKLLIISICLTLNCLNIFAGGGPNGHFLFNPKSTISYPKGKRLPTKKHKKLNQESNIIAVDITKEQAPKTEPEQEFNPKFNQITEASLEQCEKPETKAGYKNTAIAGGILTGIAIGGYCIYKYWTRNCDQKNNK